MNKHLMYDEKENEQMKKESIKDYFEATKDLKKYRRKKILIFLAIFIPVFIFIKVVWGSIELYNVLGYAPSFARYYDVKINGKQYDVSYISTHKIPIIPFLVNFNSVYLGNNRVDSTDDLSYIYNDNSSKYKIEISSYKCYAKNIQVECIFPVKDMRKNNDEKYTKTVIIRTSNPYEKLYDGKYIDDFAPYVKEKGSYSIQIYVNYGMVENVIDLIYINGLHYQTY